MATSGWSIPKLLLVNFKRASHEGFGLGQPVRRQKQLRQVVEFCGNSWVVPAEALLVDFKSAAHEGLSLGQPFRRLKQGSQVGEVSGDFWVVPAEALLVDFKSAPHEGFGLEQPVRHFEQLRQVVEVSGDVSGGPFSEALLCRFLERDSISGLASDKPVRRL